MEITPYEPNIDETVGLVSGLIDSHSAAFDGDKVIEFLERVRDEVQRLLLEAQANT